MRINNFFKLVISIAKTQGAGIVGALFTASAIPAWYAMLEKSSLNPPGWVFGPVWTLLYFFMGIAVFLVWASYAEEPTGEMKKKKRNALIAFDAQLLLNVLWSILFFGMRDPFLAFLEIIVLWCAIFVTIKLFRPISPVAAYLLVPYIAWVSFAAYLNYSVWVLN